MPGYHPPHLALLVHCLMCERVCLQTHYMCVHVRVSECWHMPLCVRCVLSPPKDQNLKGRSHVLFRNTSAIHSSPLWKPQISRKPLGIPEPLCWEQYLSRSWSSINLWWMSEWMNEADGAFVWPGTALWVWWTRTLTVHPPTSNSKDINAVKSSS